MSNNENSSPAQPAKSTPITDSIPESIVPVTSAGSSKMGMSISSPAQGLTVNQGTSNLIDPLLGNEIHTETNNVKSLNESVGISNMNSQTTMDRRSLIASRDWLTDAVAGRQIFKDQFPYCLFSSTSFPGAFALGIHEYVNATAVEFTMQVSASPFSTGILQLIWTPSHSSDLNKFGAPAETFTARDTTNPDNAIDCYSMLLNIGEGNTATLTVPLVNVLSTLRTKTNRILWTGDNPQLNFDPKNYNFWGNIAINVFNQLQGITEDEDQNLPVKLWARLIGPQTSLLKPYTNPITVSSLQTEGAMMSVAAAVGSALASAAPSLAVGAATTIVGAAANGIAHKVGKKCTYYTENGEDPMCINFALTNDHRSILSLAYDTKDFQDSCTDLSDSPAELDMKAIAARRSRISNTPWTASADVTSVITSFPVHPMTGVTLSTLPVNNVLNMSNLAFSSLSFAYWRGSITYTFEVVGNSYTRGALIVVYQPQGDTTPLVDIDQATAYPNAVINIAETRKFSLRIPYNSQTPWSRTPLIRPNGGGMNLIAPDTLGKISVLVLNPIRTNTASKLTQLDVNVYIHSVDIDYRAPYLNGSIAPTSWEYKLPVPPPTVALEPAMVSALTNFADTLKSRVRLQRPTLVEEPTEGIELQGNLEVEPLPGAEVFGPSSDPSPTSLMPHSHTDIRQLLTRRVPVSSGLLTDEVTLITIPLPNMGTRHPITNPVDPNVRQYPVPSFYNLLSGCYGWETGSQVISLMTGNSNLHSVNVVAQIVYSGDENWVPEFSRGFTVVPSTLAAYDDVLANDASLAFNVAVNVRREIGIPWYSMVSQLPAGPVYRRSDLDQTAIPAYVPFAFLKLYIRRDVIFPDPIPYTIAQNVGPNFQFSQFMGAPKFILYDPADAPPPTLARGRVVFPDVHTIPPFTDDVELQMETIQVRTNVMKCGLCPAKPASMVAFVKHLQSSHPREFKDVPFACPFCRKTGLLATWPDHNAECKMFDKLACPTCGVVVTDGEKLRNHVGNAHPTLKVDIPIPRSKPLGFRNKISTIGAPSRSSDLSLEMFSTPQAFVHMGDAAKKFKDILPNENLQDTLNHLTSAATNSSASIIDALAGVSVATDKIATTSDEISGMMPSITEFFDSGTDTFKKMNEIFTSLQGVFTVATKDGVSERDELKNRTRIFASAARAVRDRDWEPIFTEIFLEMFDRFTLVDPVLMTVGLKAILMVISPTSRMHSILTSTILAKSSLVVEKLIPDSWKEIFGSMFQGSEDDTISFGKAILLLFAFGGVVLSGLQTPTAFFREFGKNFSFLNLARSSASLSVLVDSINQLKKWIQEKYFGRSVWEGYDWLLKNRELIGGFQADYFEYLDFSLNKILNSSLLRSRAIKLGETAKMIASNLVKIRTGSNEITALMKQAEFFIQLAQQSRQVPFGLVRTRPTVVTLQGASQCGKTFLATTALPHYLNELLRWPQEPVFLVSSATEDFMSGYSQQMITMIDDLLQMKEGKDLTGFVNMIGNAPYRVNMAAIAEKGTQFLSEVVIATMNPAHPKVDKFVNHPPAIYNRLYDYYFHVVAKEPYNIGGRLNKKKVIAEGLRNPDDYLDFYRQTYVNETRIPPVRDQLAGEKVSFFQIVSLIAQAVLAEETVAKDLNDEAESQATAYPDFPADLLPDDWDTHFQSRSSSQNRALRINRIVQTLSRLRPNVPTVEPGKLYLHESQDAAFLAAETSGPTKFWHNHWKCQPHIRKYVKMSLGGISSGNPVYDFIWKSWRRASQTYAGWYATYPVLMNFLKWYALGIALQLAIQGVASFSNWWNLDPRLESEEESPTESQKRDDQESLASEFFSSESQASWYNSGSPTSGTKGKVRVARPSGVKKGVGKKAAQSDIPPMFPLVKRNTVRLTACGYSIRALGWKKDILIVNRHFMAMIPEGATITMERWTPNTATSRLESFPIKFHVADTVDFIYEDDQPMDLVLWKTGWKTGTFKDISNHFLHEEDLDRVTGQDGYRISDVITNFSNFAYTESELPFNAATMTSTKIPLAIVARGGGEKGICGSPWVVTNPAFFGNLGKICGIHAFGGKGIAGAVPITIEALESVETGFTEPSFQPSQVNFEMSADADSETTLLYHDFHGRVSASDAFIQPRRTELQPSPIFGEVCEVTHEPAVLSNRDPRLDDPAVFDRDLVKKTDRLSSWFKNESEVDVATKAIIDELSYLPIKLTPRLLTLDEAVNGVDGPPHMAETGLEMRNSPGYPWNKKHHGKGKFPFFKERVQKEGERLKYDITDPILAARVHERMTLAMQGKIPDNSIWLDVMKDELRPKAKCRSGATRIINAPPLDLMICMNVLFGAFRIFFMDPDLVGLPLESALGVDPRASWPAFGMLYKQAMTLFGVDFSKFDSSQLAEFYKQIAKIINTWYRMFQEDQTNIDQECLARETIAFEIGHTLHLYGSTLYTDDHGLPSGVPGGFTTIFNIMVNMILSRITFIRTGLHISTYRKHTRNIFLGDDGLHAVLRSEDPKINEALLKYNRIELAKVASEIGMTVTMPDKVSDLTPSDAFEDISFLKSAFTDSVIPGYYLPGMDKKTIGNLLNWYRPRKNPDQFRTNIEEALKFAAPHGKVYYNELVADLKMNGKMQVLYPGNELSEVLPPFEAVFYSTYLPFGMDGLEQTPLFDFPFEI
nr:MAG: polyprotein [Picornavirales sp.]